jgi:hypothetical protein
MEISQWLIAGLYVHAILLGIILGIVYDGLRISRVFLGARYSRRIADRLRRKELPLLPPPKERQKSPFLGPVIFFEDLFFAIFGSVAFILMQYAENNGKFRFLAVAFTVAGFFIYRATVGRLVMLFSEIIAFFIGIFVRYLIFFTLLPFRWIAKRIGILLSTCRRWVDQTIQKKQRIRYTERLLRDADACACGMIPKKEQDRLKKEGMIDAGKDQETIQSEHACTRFSCTDRRHFPGRVCKQRHAIQSTQRGRG